MSLVFYAGLGELLWDFYLSYLSELAYLLVKPL